MAKKKSLKDDLPASKNAGKGVQGKQTSASSTRFGWQTLTGLTLVLVLVFLAFHPMLKNSFLHTWDDLGYTLELHLVTAPFSPENTVAIFKTFSVMGNYHPLTLLSLNIDYNLNGRVPNAYSFLRTNLILHLLITCMAFLVCIYVGKILKREEKFSRLNEILFATLATYLFCIHPLRAESVAWISERKDELYVFFYLAAMLSHLKYLEKGRPNWILAVTWICFLLSVLSKGPAVTLPIVLLLIDDFEGRFNRGILPKLSKLSIWQKLKARLSAIPELIKLNRSLLLEKALLFIPVSISFGIVAFFAQSDSHSITFQERPYWIQILFGGYGFLHYVQKLIWPAGLSAYYLYQLPKSSMLQMIFFTLSPAIVLGIFVVIWKCRNNKILWFGLSFSLITLILLLQFLAVGGAMVADRYSFLASFGLSIIVSTYTCILLAIVKWPGKIGLLLATITCGIGLFTATNAQVKVWKNDVTLWENAYEHDKKNVAALSHLIHAHFVSRNYPEVVRLCTEELELQRLLPIANDEVARIFGVRAIAQSQLGNFVEAASDATESIRLGYRNSAVFKARGLALISKGNFTAAITNLDSAISLDTLDAEAYRHRATAKIGNFQNDEAFPDLQKSLELDSTVPQTYQIFGLWHGYRNDPKMAVHWFSEAIALKSDYAEAYQNRGTSYMRLKKYELAKNDLLKTLRIGGESNFPETLVNLGDIYLIQNYPDSAAIYYKKVQENDPLFSYAQEKLKSVH